MDASPKTPHDRVTIQRAGVECQKRSKATYLAGVEVQMQSVDGLPGL